jgi:hypothetical protein
LPDRFLPIEAPLSVLSFPTTLFGAQQSILPEGGTDVKKFLLEIFPGANPNRHGVLANSLSNLLPVRAFVSSFGARSG